MRRGDDEEVHCFCSNNGRSFLQCCGGESSICDAENKKKDATLPLTYFLVPDSKELKVEGKVVGRTTLQKACGLS